MSFIAVENALRNPHVCRFRLVAGLYTGGYYFFGYSTESSSPCGSVEDTYTEDGVNYPRLNGTDRVLQLATVQSINNPNLAYIQMIVEPVGRAFSTTKTFTIEIHGLATFHNVPYSFNSVGREAYNVIISIDKLMSNGTTYTVSIYENI